MVNLFNRILLYSASSFHRYAKEMGKYPWFLRHHWVPVITSIYALSISIILILHRVLRVSLIIICHVHIQWWERLGRLAWATSMWNGLRDWLGQPACGTAWKTGLGNQHVERMRDWLGQPACGPAWETGLGNQHVERLGSTVVLPLWSWFSWLMASYNDVLSYHK